MKILNNYEMSIWAFEECGKGNDHKEIIDLIKSPPVAYLYCKFIKCDSNVRNTISDEMWNHFEKNSYYQWGAFCVNWKYIDKSKNTHYTTIRYTSDPKLTLGY